MQKRYFLPCGLTAGWQRTHEAGLISESLSNVTDPVWIVQTHGLCDDSDFVFLNAFVLQ